MFQMTLTCKCIGSRAYEYFLVSQVLSFKGLSQECKSQTHLCILSGRHVPEASERINIVFTWVQQLLQDRKREGGMAEATSTVWSLLSNGYSQFELCRCAK